MFKMAHPYYQLSDKETGLNKFRYTFFNSDKALSKASN